MPTMDANGVWGWGVDTAFADQRKIRDAEMDRQILADKRSHGIYWDILHSNAGSFKWLLGIGAFRHTKRPETDITLSNYEYLWKDETPISFACRMLKSDVVAHMLASKDTGVCGSIADEDKHKYTAVNYAFLYYQTYNVPLSELQRVNEKVRCHITMLSAMHAAYPLLLAECLNKGPNGINFPLSLAVKMPEITLMLKIMSFGANDMGWTQTESRGPGKSVPCSMPTDRTLRWHKRVGEYFLIERWEQSVHPRVIIQVILSGHHMKEHTQAKQLPQNLVRRLFAAIACDTAWVRKPLLGLALDLHNAIRETRMAFARVPDYPIYSRTQGAAPPQQ